MILHYLGWVFNLYVDNPTRAVFVVCRMQVDHKNQWAVTGLDPVLMILNGPLGYPSCTVMTQVI